MFSYMEQCQRSQCFQPFCGPAHPGLDGVLKKVLICLCTAVLNCSSRNFVLAQAFWQSPVTAVCKSLFWSTQLAIGVTHGSLPQRPERIYTLELFLQGLSMLHTASVPFSFRCQGTCVLSGPWTAQRSNFSALKTPPSSINKFGITDPAS